MRKGLVWAQVLLLFAAAAVAALPEKMEPEPWDVSYPRWSGNFFLEPGGKVVVKINVTFLEPGAYGAFFKLYAYREEGLVHGIPLEPTLLGVAELPPDVYSSTVTLTIEATVPVDVACGAPVYVEGYVMGRSRQSFAVVGGKEEPFVTYYVFDLAPACALTVRDALEVYRELGGKEGLSKLNAQLESSRKEAEGLRRELERVQGEKARLERALTSTQAELEKLAAEKTTLKERLSAVEAENAKLNTTVAQLNQQLNQQLLGLTGENQLLKLAAAILAVAFIFTALYAVKARKK